MLFLYVWVTGHQQNAHTTSSASPPPTAQPSPLSPEDQHRELDDLLNDMLLNVENIPDVRPSRIHNQQDTFIPDVRRSASLHQSSSASTGDTLETVIRTLDNVSFIDDTDDSDIPYHARQDSRPFTYGSVVENTGEFIIFVLKSDLKCFFCSFCATKILVSFSLFFFFLQISRPLFFTHCYFL